MCVCCICFYHRQSAKSFKICPWTKSWTSWDCDLHPITILSYPIELEDLSTWHSLQVERTLGQLRRCWTLRDVGVNGAVKRSCSWYGYFDDLGAGSGTTIQRRSLALTQILQDVWWQLMIEYIWYCSRIQIINYHGHTHCDQPGFVAPLAEQCLGSLPNEDYPQTPLEEGCGGRLPS